jgi:hypothetical protein
MAWPPLGAMAAIAPMIFLPISSLIDSGVVPGLPMLWLISSTILTMILDMAIICSVWTASAPIIAEASIFQPPPTLTSFNGLLSPSIVARAVSLDPSR